MTATQSRVLEVQDVEYLRHGDKPLLARVFKPQGRGPFPAIVQVHGGAWCEMDRQRDSALDISVALSGVVVVAIDFRMPPAVFYPAPLADINYAVRWLKMRAGELGTRADLVGIMGTSSGGHQAMLTALRPRDPRYAAIALPGSATSLNADVRCAVLCYPVLNPVERFQYAKALANDSSDFAQWYSKRQVPRNLQYWQTEEAMSEGSPVLIMERGEPVHKPPVLWVQSTGDKAHPRSSNEQFVALYRKAGGVAETELFEEKEADFLTFDPSSPAARGATTRITEFIHRHVV